MAPTHIRIRDVTERDGEQAPGRKMTRPEKLEIGDQLHLLNVDEIEGGFASASAVDYDALQALSATVGQRPRSRHWGPDDEFVTISSLALLTEESVRKALDAVKEARNRAVHTFIGTSHQQRLRFADSIRRAGVDPENHADFIERYVIRAIERVLPQIREMDPGAAVQFSPEDWTRTDDAVSDDVILAAAANGATIINLPDTVGIGSPDIVCKRVARVRRLLDKHGFKHVKISWHGHGDASMGIANAMAALHGGATQFEPTILGIGERAGNFSFEGFLAALDALKLHHEERIALMRLHPVLRPIVEWLTDSGIMRSGRVEIDDLLVREETKRTAELVARILGIQIPKEHPISGENVFKTESGLHVQGLLAGGYDTYYVLDPERYGARATIALGQSSGWGAVKDFFGQQGLPYSEQHRMEFTTAVKEAGTRLARRRGLEDQEVLSEAIYPTMITLTGGAFAVSVTDVPNPGGPHTVDLHLRDNQVIRGVARQGGRIDAIIHAMQSVLPGVDIPTETFMSRGIREGNSGSGGKAETRVQLRNRFTVTEVAQDTDTQLADEKALLKAFNALYAIEEYARQIEAEEATATEP